MTESTERILFNGNRVWMTADDIYHRIGGPAIIRTDGSEEWWVNGKLNREDGPAVIGPDGRGSWWLNHKELFKNDFTSCEMIERMQAWVLFTVEELFSFDSADSL